MLLPILFLAALGWVPDSTPRAIAPADEHDVTPLTISNHSFELPVIAAGTFSTTAAPPGWSVYGNGINFGSRTIGVLNPTTTTLYIEPTPDGQNVGVIFLMDNFSNQTYFAGIEAGLQQTLTATLQSRRRYTLRVDVGNLTSEPDALYRFLGFPNYRIDLMAGSTVLASDTNSLLPGEGRYLPSTLVVDVAAGHPLAGQLLRIRLVNLNSAPGIEVNWDNVRLESSLIPSPVLRLTHDAPSGQMSLRWPDSPGGPYAVQSTEDLTSPIAWDPVFDAPQFDAGTWSLSLPTPTGTRYYRLQPQ